MNKQKILENLPYSPPFLFVDEIATITDIGVVGFYTFKTDAFFYEGHFKNNPVTPGVILTECCAQIGVVSLGIHLMAQEISGASKIGLSSSEMEFLKPVFPGEKVRVESKKEYFRFHKLKCTVKMYDSSNELVCKGIIAGMVKNNPNGE